MFHLKESPANHINFRLQKPGCSCPLLQTWVAASGLHLVAPLLSPNPDAYTGSINAS